MTDEEISDDEIRSSVRRVSAGPIFKDVWNDPYYDFVKECFGAYKLEFTWGLANWEHVSDSFTAFGYTHWVHADEVEPSEDLPEGSYGVYDHTMYAECEYPVMIEFDIPDFRHAVCSYATGYDDCDDGSEINARQKALEKLRVWQAAIDTLCGQLEDELKERNHGQQQ